MIKTMTAETVHFAIAKKLKDGSSYIDAICEFASENDMEIETLATVIKKSEILKSKIRSEALDLRMIKRDPDDDRILCD